MKIHKPKPIIVVGSSNTDMIIKVHRIPKPGETILGGEFSTAPGGKGANQAVAAARAGGDVIFIAKIGNDLFGKQTIQNLKKDKISTKYVSIDPQHPSGVALIFVAKDGENSIAVAPGANANLQPQDVILASNALENGGLILMQLEIPLDTIKTAANLAAKNNIPVILNPAPATQLPDDLLQLCSIITPNESETEILTGVKITSEKSIIKAAHKLMDKGPNTVIITLGARGAFVVSKDLTGLIPAFKVKPVDTTAAGDVFNGALAVAIQEGKSLIDALTFANAAAALSVTKLGAQPSAPYRKEIIDFLNTHKNN